MLLALRTVPFGLRPVVCPVVCHALPAPRGRCRPMQAVHRGASSLRPPENAVRSSNELRPCRYDELCFIMYEEVPTPAAS